jgi:SPP1 gp7 family putative phage head morphogenesis protein
VTLDPISGSFRPGGATSPQPVTPAGPEPYQLQFLSAEERATAVLMGFYEDARLDLETFIRTGDLTVSDATFYRRLLDETDRIASKVNGQAATWVSGTIPDAYSAAWRASSSVVVPQAALEALSRDTLGLLTQTSSGMKQAVRQTIAAGILQGLSGADVRQRIIGTGLTNIPHWPSVEYRAGVIARTETMRAFNQGAIDVSNANGALFYEWIASPDEATCPICLPRDGKVFRRPGFPIGGAPGMQDPFGPAIRELPSIPAHPRCRCTVRARYRDQNGNVIRQGSTVVDEPKLPADAMGGTDAPVLPAAVGDLKKAFGKLGREDFTDGFIMSNLLKANPGLISAEGRALAEAYNAQRAFWRSLGRLTDDELRLLTHGMTGKLGNQALKNFLDLRYGIAFPKPVGWIPDLRLSTLRALERIREKWPRYVVDSKYLSVLGAAPPGARRFPSNAIARAFPTGHVQGNMGLWSKFAGPDGQKLRAGPNVDAAEEVIIHEFVHTIHFRFGLYDPAVHTTSQIRDASLYPAAEAVEQIFHVEFGALRKKSVGVAPDESSLATLEASLAAYREKAASAPVDSFERRWADNMAERTEASISKLREQLASAGGQEFYPTSYARESVAEDFAETGMLYLLNPSFLQKWSPGRYEFMRTRVFAE